MKDYAEHMSNYSVRHGYNEQVEEIVSLKYKLTVSKNNYDEMCNNYKELLVAVNWYLDSLGVNVSKRRLETIKHWIKMSKKDKKI